MISILNNFRHKTGTWGLTARHNVGYKPTLTTTVAVLDHSTTVGQNLESVNSYDTSANRSWVANPRGLK